MIHQMEDLVDLAEFDECCCDAFGDILTLSILAIVGSNAS